MILMKTAFVILALFIESFSQSYVFNVYDNPFVDRRDGRMYNLFGTDSSIWFVDNLKFDPDSVYGIDYLSTNSYCDNFLEANCDYSGRLYFWDAAVNACPEGWHLPNKKEWEELISFLDQQPYLKNVFVQSPLLHGEVDVMDSKRRVGFIDVISEWWMSELRHDADAYVAIYPIILYEHGRYSRRNNRKLKKKQLPAFFKFDYFPWHLHRVQIMPGRYTESDIVVVAFARCVKNKDGENYDVEIPTNFSGDESLTEFCE